MKKRLFSASMEPLTPDLLREHIQSENPWWHGRAPLYRELARRPYFDLFAPNVVQRRPRRALVLMGPRRVGKTVLLHHAIELLLANGVPPQNIAYLSLDHPLYNKLGLDVLANRVREISGHEPDAPTFLFLDEIQYLKDWERYLKALVDARHNIKAVVSGSAAAVLRLKSMESGAGRFSDFFLPPLTFYEFIEMQNLGHLVRARENADISELNKCFVDYLNFGGFPEALRVPEVREDPKTYFGNHVIEKVLGKDIPSLYGVTNTPELNKIFVALAHRTGMETSLEELSRHTDVTKPTLDKYLQYIEAAFLAKRVYRVDANARRFKRNPRFKVYLTNPSVRSALFSTVSGDDDAIGALVETALFAQWPHKPNIPLHYARWKRGEVDLVLLNALHQPRLCIEAKWSDRKPWPVKPLATFAERNPSVEKIILTTRTQFEALDIPGVPSSEILPTSVYCYRVGEELLSKNERPA